MQHSLLIGFFLLLFLSPLASAQEHSSEWLYVDERWPQHIGPLFDDIHPEAYIHQVVDRESQRLSGWNGRYGTPALDTVTACGLTFDGYLRQRPKGTYLVIVISSADGQIHKLKWIPVEYRYDNEKPRYFLRPNAKPNPELERKYLFDDGGAFNEQRTRGAPDIQPSFKYLEVVKFPTPRELTRHELLQVYLPWVDECAEKPVFRFERHASEEVVWDYPMTAWVSAGYGGLVPLSTPGWTALHPTPDYYLRFADYWPHHGFSAELHMAQFQSATSTNQAAYGFFAKASYGYDIRASKYLWIVPEAGFRTVFGFNGFMLPGFGAGLDFALEIPGTRHHSTGQRMLIEGGCDAQLYPGGGINGHDTAGPLGACKIGLGLGW